MHGYLLPGIVALAASLLLGACAADDDDTGSPPGGDDDDAGPSLPDPITTEELTRSLLLGDVEIPAAGEVDLFAREADATLAAAVGAVAVFEAERQRRDPPPETSGSLLFSESPPVALDPGGYAFWVDPEQDAVTVYAAEGDVDAFTDATLEMLRLALQDGGRLPQGLFVHPSGPVMEYRAFHMAIPRLLYGDHPDAVLEVLYEAGRASALLGLRHLVVATYFGRLDLSGLEDEFPGVRMFEQELSESTLTPSDLRARFVELKQAYPVEVEPALQVAKLAQEAPFIEEEHLEPLPEDLPPKMAEKYADSKYRCYKILENDHATVNQELIEDLASLARLARYMVAADAPGAAGASATSYVYLGADEPYTILGSRSQDVLADAGRHWGRYLEALRQEIQTAVGDDVRIVTWHDSLYCDEQVDVLPMNGCADWPDWLVEYLDGDARGPLHEATGELDRAALTPGIWIYHDYETTIFEQVIQHFDDEGFGAPICATWGVEGETDEGGSDDSFVNVLRHGEACEAGAGLGLVQTSWMSLDAYEENIVAAALVTSFGYQAWMEQLTPEILSAFRANLGFEPAEIMVW